MMHDPTGKLRRSVFFISRKIRMKKKRKPGCPSKYTPDYCKRIVEFFDIEPYREVEVTITHKDGSEYTKTELKANDLRFLSAFARSIGVSQDSLHEWAKKYPEFCVALKKAKDLQAEHLITNGLHNTFAQPFAIFTAKNILGWRDKQDLELSGDVIIRYGHRDGK